MVPLNEFVEGRLPTWPEPARSASRRALAVALGELAARLHEAGFVHDDFHPGNLMVRMGPRDGRPQLALIDLDALRTRRKLSLGRGPRQSRAVESLLLDALRPVGSPPLPRRLPGGPRLPPARPEGLRECDRGGHRARGPSATGGVAGGVAGGRTSISRAIGASPVVGRRLARPRPADRRGADGRDRRPRSAGHDAVVSEAFAHHDRRRDDPAGVRRVPDARDLQDLPPQEVARPHLRPLPAVAGLAGLAGGPAPQQPRRADAQEPRDPRPHPARLAPIPAPRDLPRHRQGRARHDPGRLSARSPADARPRRPPRPHPTTRPRPGPTHPRPARAVALASRPQGGEYPDRGRPRRRRAEALA